ncbi:MAG: SRPBCC domain-containing protein [Bacteroidota bacterium]
MFAVQTYREWTSVFNPTSYYDGKWEKGAKMLFLGTNADGKKEGMVSIIRDFVPNKFVDIEHIGMISGDEEITSGEAVNAWAGAHEKYLFFDENGKTVLIVELDTTEEFKSYFFQTYPKALEKLKSICEEK